MSKRLNKIHPHKSKIQEQLFVFFRHTLTYKQTDRLTHRQVVRKTDRQTQTDVQAGR